MRILVPDDTRNLLGSPAARVDVPVAIERYGSDITIVQGGATGVDEAEELRDLYPSPKPQKVI